jgi:ATP-dependent exoDNAse (exonuclease V) beta subunit
MLKKEWDDATTYGTKVHKAIENLVNFGVEEEDTYFITDTFMYTMEQHGIKPLVCEFTVYDETIKRASNIDIIGEKDGRLVIVDTKTMAKPIERNSYKGKRCFYPIAHLEQTKFNKHALQVNIYRHWLKTKYGCDVCDFNYVFSFNEASSSIVQMIEIPPMDEEINLIYEYLKTITPQ